NHAGLTTIVVLESAPAKRVSALSKHVKVIVAPFARGGFLDLRWLLKRLGGEDVTSLLVEGGGKVNASFLLQGLAHRIAFFYAPKVVGGHEAVKAVSGPGFDRWEDVLRLHHLESTRLGDDIFLTADILRPASGKW